MTRSGASAIWHYMLRGGQFLTPTPRVRRTKANSLASVRAQDGERLVDFRRESPPHGKGEDPPDGLGGDHRTQAGLAVHCRPGTYCVYAAALVDFAARKTGGELPIVAVLSRGAGRYRSARIGVQKTAGRDLTRRCHSRDYAVASVPPSPFRCSAWKCVAARLAPRT